jgi:death on curing protein
LAARYLSVADVLALHAEAMALDGARPAALRGGGEALLESAVMKPRMAAHYEAASLIRQASLLTVGISQNQPFLDGNKRTAYLAALVFLDVNGLALDDSDEAFAHQLIRVAERTESLDSALDTFEAWLSAHVGPRAVP